MATMKQALEAAKVVTSKKLEVVKSAFDSIDMFSVALRKQFISGKFDPREFVTQEQVHSYLISEMKRMLDIGDYAYDPSEGEIIMVLEKSNAINLYGRLKDGTVVASVITRFFEDQGWDKVVLIPERTGCHKTLVKFRSDQLLYAVLRK